MMMTDIKQDLWCKVYIHSLATSATLEGARSIADQAVEGFNNQFKNVDWEAKYFNLKNKMIDDLNGINLRTEKRKAEDLSTIRSYLAELKD